MSSQQSVPPSGPRMCTGKNCNFYGDPMTGMCSKCYREEQAARKAANGGVAAPTTAAIVAAPLPTPVAAPAATPVPTSTAMPVSAPVAIPGRAHLQQLDDFMPSSMPTNNGFPSSLSSSPSAGLMATSASPPGKSASNRCHLCQKKVGLLGFKCRCEQTFCSSHRHTDAHNCTFDYKAAGREELAKNNPLIVTKKVEKI